MYKVQVSDFKANFSAIIDKVQNENAVYLIQYGRKRAKVAVLMPYDKYVSDQPGIKLGLLEGKGKLSFEEDFEMTEEGLLGLASE